MSKLDDIYLETVYGSGGGPAGGTVFGINLDNDAVWQALKAQFKELMLELIGHNEHDPDRNARWQAYRNELRIEFTQKVNDL